MIDTSKLISILSEQQKILHELQELMKQLEQTWRETYNEFSKGIPDEVFALEENCVCAKCAEPVKCMHALRKPHEASGFCIHCV